MEATPAPAQQPLVSERIGSEAPNPTLAAEALKLTAKAVEKEVEHEY